VVERLLMPVSLMVTQEGDKEVVWYNKKENRYPSGQPQKNSYTNPSNNW
jgi:hypothetical protein